MYVYIKKVAAGHRKKKTDAYTYTHAHIQTYLTYLEREGCLPTHTINKYTARFTNGDALYTAKRGSNSA